MVNSAAQAARIKREASFMKKVLALALALVLALGCASFAMAEEEKPLIGILAPATTHGWVGGVAYFDE